jgi:O-methyltransferase involved in polyketide biosynthesis
LLVNLAAGLDTRPYRLELPSSLVWIEADLPGIIEEKERLLAGSEPGCQLVRERADLACEAARRSFLDRALAGRHKALIITEGLLMYLREETVRSLAHDLGRPEVAWWVFEILSPPIRDAIMKSMKAELANAPMVFAPANGVAFFEALGWKVLGVYSLFHEASRLHRLPWLLSLLAKLPIPKPDPRNVAKARWSAVALVGR